MIGFESLPSFDTRKGKLLWCGIFTFLAASFALEMVIDAFCPHPNEKNNS